MDSRRFEQLNAYLDGELSREERAEFEQWLQAHPEAKYCYRELARLSDHLSGRLGTPLPDAGSTGTMVDLDRLITHSRNRTLVVWGSMGGAAAALLVMVGWVPGWLTPPSPTLMSQYLLEDPASANPYLVLLGDDVLAQK